MSTTDRIAIIFFIFSGAGAMVIFAAYMLSRKDPPAPSDQNPAGVKAVDEVKTKDE